MVEISKKWFIYATRKFSTNLNNRSRKAFEVCFSCSQIEKSKNEHLSYSYRNR